MKKIMLTTMAAAAALAAEAVMGTLNLENGGSKTGEIKWSARSKSYVVTQKKGSSMIDEEVAVGEVASLDIVKPAGMDQAAALVQKGQGASAIGTLQGIVKDYAHLQWDQVAGRYLAEAYLAAGKTEQALEACQGVIKGDPTAAFKGDLAPAYWECLLALGQKNKLESALAKAAASGDRFSSGAAFIKRGDIVWKDGNESAEAAKKALADGYLRAVLMYRDQPAIQPEALFKAALCFEKMGHSGRADQYRGELRKSYPTSPWTSKL